MCLRSKLTLNLSYFSFVKRAKTKQNQLTGALLQIDTQKCIELRKNIFKWVL